MVHPVCLSFLLSLLEPGLGGMTYGSEVGVCSSRGRGFTYSRCIMSSKRLWLFTSSVAIRGGTSDPRLSPVPFSL